MTSHITLSDKHTFYHFSETNKLLVLDHSLLVCDHRKRHSLNSWSLQTTCNLSLRPESKTSYSARYQTHNSSTLQSWGGRTQDHSLVVCSPYTIQWIVQDTCRRDVANFPSQTLVLCSTTFSAIFLNKGMAARVQRTTAIKLLPTYYTSWQHHGNNVSAHGHWVDTLDKT